MFHVLCLSLDIFGHTSTIMLVLNALLIFCAAHLTLPLIKEWGVIFFLLEMAKREKL